MGGRGAGVSGEELVPTGDTIDTLVPRRTECVDLLPLASTRAAGIAFLR